VHLVEVLVEEDGDLEQRSGAAPRHANPTVALEAEERPQALLAAPRRTELDQEVRDVALGVHEAVSDARRHDEDLTGSENAPPQAVLADSPLAELLPVRELAYGLVSYYLGANLVTHLGGAEPTAALFERLEELAPTLAALLRS
jgi:hypothetical protein